MDSTLAPKNKDRKATKKPKNVRVDNIIWYAVIFPVANITIHNGAEKASIDEQIIINTQNIDVQSGTVDNHICRI